MRVLVTGAAGFIGSHLSEALLDRGWDVLGIDSLHPMAHRGVPPYIDPRMEFEELDINDAERIEVLVRDADAVCHQAAMVGLGKSFDDAPDYVGVNDLGTAVLLRSLYRADLRGPLVLASSMAVYGEGAYRCPVDGTVRPAPRRRADLEEGRFEPRCDSCGRKLTAFAITETFPPDPRNVYAATKLHQEHLCSSFGRETGVRVVALRYHNVYGPRMPADSPYSGVAAVFRSAVEAGAAPKVFEDGGQLRDFIHVTDVAEANVLALSVPGARGAYNVATGHPRSVGEMAQSLWAARAGDGPPPEVTGSYRAGDVRHVFASPARASDDLGFTATVGFEQGMEMFASEGLRGPQLSTAEIAPNGLGV